LAGTLVRVDGRYYVVTDKRQGWARQTFTAAYEHFYAPEEIGRMLRVSFQAVVYRLEELTTGQVVIG